MSDTENLYAFGGYSVKNRIARLEASMPRIQGGGIRTSTSAYRAIDASALSNGRVNLSSSKAIAIRGSIVPTANNPSFGVVTTGTTASIYWDGTNGSSVIVMILPDGTNQTIPPGSITVSGLTPSTTYNLIPYWAPYNSCTISWVQGNAGAPQICFTGTPTTAQQAQAYQLAREPLSDTYLTLATTAGAPSGGGSIGSGGGPGFPPNGCVMLGTDIEPLDDAEYIRVMEPCSEWWHLQVKGGKTLYCTPDHPVYDYEGFRRRADSFQVGDFVTMRYGTDEVCVSEPHRRVCTKVKVSMPRVKLYWANDFLSHNVKIHTS